MIVTKLISTSIKKGLRLIKVSAYGKNDIRESPECMPYGLDSNPIANMQAIYAPTSVNGSNVIIGYINTNQLATAGEFRGYSTDANGSQKAYWWLRSNGDLELNGNANHAAQYEGLQTAFNQLKSDFNNLVTIYNSHVHTGVTTGSGSSGTTPATGSSSSADITGAKLTNIKTQ